MRTRIATYVAGRRLARTLPRSVIRPLLATPLGRHVARSRYDRLIRRLLDEAAARTMPRGH
jgi:phage baseplate assembly protein W